MEYSAHNYCTPDVRLVTPTPDNKIHKYSMCPSISINLTSLFVRAKCQSPQRNQTLRLVDEPDYDVETSTAYMGASSVSAEDANHWEEMPCSLSPEYLGGAWAQAHLQGLATFFFFRHFPRRSILDAAF